MIMWYNKELGERIHKLAFNKIRSLVLGSVLEVGGSFEFNKSYKHINSFKISLKNKYDTVILHSIFSNDNLKRAVKIAKKRVIIFEPNRHSLDGLIERLKGRKFGNKVNVKGRVDSTTLIPKYLLRIFPVKPYGLLSRLEKFGRSPLKIFARSKIVVLDNYQYLVKSHFDEFGEKWIEDMDETMKMLYERAEKTNINFLDVKKGDRCLDIACGRGTLAGMMSELGGISTGVDINPKMLKLASKKYKKCKFVKAFAEKLPFKDNSFDKITIGAVTEYTNNPEACVREVYRVLKPGGFAVFWIANYPALLRLRLWISDRLPRSNIDPRKREAFLRHKNKYGYKVYKRILRKLSIPIVKAKPFRLFHSIYPSQKSVFFKEYFLPGSLFLEDRLNKIPLPPQIGSTVMIKITK